MKVRVEFEATRDGAQRIEEAADFLVFWHDPDGAISWTHTGWSQTDIEEALAKARASESIKPVIVQ